MALSRTSTRRRRGGSPSTPSRRRVDDEARRRRAASTTSRGSLLRGAQDVDEASTRRSSSRPGQRLVSIDGADTSIVLDRDQGSASSTGADSCVDGLDHDQTAMSHPSTRPLQSRKTRTRAVTAVPPLLVESLTDAEATNSFRLVLAALRPPPTSADNQSYLRTCLATRGWYIAWLEWNHRNVGLFPPEPPSHPPPYDPDEEREVFGWFLANVKIPPPLQRWLVTKTEEFEQSVVRLIHNEDFSARVLFGQGIRALLASSHDPSKQVMLQALLSYTYGLLHAKDVPGNKLVYERGAAQAPNCWFEALVSPPVLDLHYLVEHMETDDCFARLNPNLERNTDDQRAYNPIAVQVAMQVVLRRWQHRRDRALLQRWCEFVLLDVEDAVDENWEGGLEMPSVRQLTEPSIDDSLLW